MDLTAWLLRRVPVRPLIVSVPGEIGARLAVERLVRERGWRAAASPAGANLLVEAGTVGADLRPYVEEVWNWLPGPCARAEVGSPAVVSAALDAAVVTLRDAEEQRRRAAHRSARGSEVGRAAVPSRVQHNHNHGRSHEHSHGHHGHHGHHAGGGETPGGVPLAERADDRDGLRLDRLRVPLGPVLPDWPAGLVVRARLQGDVIEDAATEVVGLGEARRDTVWSSPNQRLIVGRLDSCARLLSVVGWPDAAVTARRLRDDVLCGGYSVRTARTLAGWSRRMRRSRMLRWLLAGVGRTPEARSTPPGLVGDAWSRFQHWVDSVGWAFGRSGADMSVVDDAGAARWTLAALPSLLAGMEFANARLCVASLDPDLGTFARREVGHG